MLSTIIIIFHLYFPGQQSEIAFRLATGIKIHHLQSKIDTIEEKSIHNTTLPHKDILFLKDFYTALYKGASLLPGLQQSGRLMKHYLSASGRPLMLPSKMFTENIKIVKQAKRIKQEIISDWNNRQIKPSYRSKLFYMPDPSVPDSIYGLYWGYIEVKVQKNQNAMVLQWQAHVPWQWPSYKALKEKTGSYHAESFPIPNFLSTFFGNQYALYVDNGLGHHLTTIGLAKSFNAHAQWQEAWTPK